MPRTMDRLTECISQFQRGQMSRRQLLERGAALGLSAAGLAALGAINPVAGQERFVRPSLRTAPARQGETFRVALATPQKTGDLGPTDAKRSIVARREWSPNPPRAPHKQRRVRTHSWMLRSSVPWRS